MLKISSLSAIEPINPSTLTFFYALDGFNSIEPYLQLKVTLKNDQNEGAPFTVATAIPSGTSK
jgi:hypothetical protein